MIGSKSRFSNPFRHVIVQNVLSLYGVQVVGYVVSLFTVPYLARVLGAAGWGLVAFAQAFGSYVILVGEYGFSLSATREVAHHRDNREKLTEIFAGVLGAKTLLAAASLLLALIVRWCVPVFREHPTILWAGMFWALAQVFNMMWFFQGFERFRLVAAIDITAKIMATIGILVLVRRPEDGGRLLIVQGCGFLLSSAVILGLAYRKLPVRLPKLSSTCEALRMGWSMFLFRGSVSLYTVGNAFILGLFVSPQLVGYYAGAERISGAFIRLFGPVSQTLYPRLSHLVWHARIRAARLARIGVLIMGGGGVAIGVLVFVLAPLLVRIILGPNFGPAVPVLRVLSLLIPFVGINYALGMQWMLPLRLDRVFNTIVLLGGLINISLAKALATSYKGVGMACAVVTAEVFVGASMYLVLSSRNLNPLSYPPKDEPGIA